MTRAFKIAAIAALLCCTPLAAEQFTFLAEWRFFDAGRAVIQTSSRESTVDIASMGVVGKLHPVKDRYHSTYADGLCVLASLMQSQEGEETKETRVTFAQGKARSEEKDMADGKIEVKEVAIPACVHDVIGALMKLRTERMLPGAETKLPVSDGRRSIQARVKAEKVETVKTPAGTFRAMRHEAFLMNGAFYRRKGQLFIWISDDDRRIPVQIQVQLPFYVGDVTLRLESIAPDAPAPVGQAILR